MGLSRYSPHRRFYEKGKDYVQRSSAQVKEFGRRTADIRVKVTRVGTAAVAGALQFVPGVGQLLTPVVIAAGAQANYYNAATYERYKGAHGKEAREEGREERKRTAIYGVGGALLGLGSAFLVSALAPSAVAAAPAASAAPAGIGASAGGTSVVGASAGTTSLVSASAGTTSLVSGSAGLAAGSSSFWGTLKDIAAGVYQYGSPLAPFATNLLGGTPKPPSGTPTQESPSVVVNTGGGAPGSEAGGDPGGTQAGAGSMGAGKVVLLAAAAGLAALVGVALVKRKAA